MTATLRHYKFINPKTRYSFYVPVHQPQPFNPDDTVDAQLFKWFKANGHRPKDLVILETSTRRINQPFMAYYMSREFSRNKAQ